jgi:hypothetical protein
MGHHYLPRYYLKGFLENPHNRFLYQYEKGKTKPIKGSLENLAQENDLYSPELEMRLNAEIEKPAKGAYSSDSGQSFLLIPDACSGGIRTL